MTKFSPYTIHHIQLHAINDLKLTKGNHYVVIWFMRIPLAHNWLSCKEEHPLEYFKEDVSKSLLPALSYYLERGGGISYTSWGAYLENGEYNKVEDLLRQCRPDLDEPVLSSKTLSVVICTRNRPSDLENCIKSLLLSADTTFELIIIDNAPDDDSTESVVKRYPAIVYIKEERKGLDIARNTGARNAKGDIIAYTDDDVIVDQHWTALLKTAFQDPLTMAVTGLVIPHSLDSYSQYVFEKEWGFNKGYLPLTFDHRYFLNHLEEGVPVWDIGAGANMAFRRQVFNLAGWFDERLDVGAAGCSGDSAYWYSVLAEGWNCRYLPDIFVYHQHRKSEKALRKQLFYYMRGHVCALMIQHEKYGHPGNLKRMHRTLPRYYLNKLINAVRGTGKLLFVLTEISGCFSGWRYYASVKNRHPIHSEPLIDDLQTEVSVSKESLVSIVITCYNYGRFLDQAIKSVFSQTHSSIELVVVDDGSEDNTAEICSTYSQLTYIRTERVGFSAARNIGVEFCKGSFIVFLDADDYLYPNAVELNLFFFNIYKKAGFVSGAHNRIDKNNNYLPGKDGIVKEGDNYISLLQGNYIGMLATVMYRRTLFPRFHFDTALPGCEDYDLYLRIARYLPVFSHAEKIAVYRIHGSNTSRDSSKMYNSAIRVLEVQKSLLQSDEEKQALIQGMTNWKHYYSK